MTQSLATWQAAHDAMWRAIPVLIRKGMPVPATLLQRRMIQIREIMSRINHEIMEGP